MSDDRNGLHEPEPQDEPQDVEAAREGERRAPPSAGSAEDAAAARDPAGDPDTAADPVQLLNELEALRAQLAEANSKFLRARADLDTYRRRAQADLERAREAGQDSAVVTVLSVYDDLGRALTMADEDDPAKLLPGIRTVLSGLERNLETLGIRRIGLVGERFDPDLHEALSALENTNPERSGTIAEVFEAGFVKGERLVRPARVLVYQ